MLKLRIAEEILSIATTRCRAETIAGDLYEQSHRASAVAFLGSVVGVALALFTGGFGRARRQTLGLVGIGFVCWCAVYFTLRMLGSLLGVEPAPLERGFAAQSLTVQAYLVTMLIVSSFVTGAALGRIMTRSGMNGALPLGMFWATVAVAAPLLEWQLGTLTWDCTFIYVAGLPTCYVLPLLAGGGVTARRTAPLGASG